jgi:DNA uptake protein ComE-like DNA-binding protein
MKRAAIALSLLLAATLNAQHPADPSTSKPLTPPPVVNVNTATPAQLMYLPGIGGQTAAAIIQARPFRAPADLMRVRGIKAAKFAKMAPYVVVAGPTTASAKIKGGAK